MTDNAQFKQPKVTDAGAKEAVEKASGLFHLSNAEKKRLLKAYPDWKYDPKEMLDAGFWLQTENKELIEKELKRQSKWTKKALKSGWIRPFLLLVSMHPAYRAAIGRALDVDILEGTTVSHADVFGDPHHEAWNIIRTGRRGLQSRSEHFYREKVKGKEAAWYQVVARLGKRLDTQSDAASELSDARKMKRAADEAVKNGTNTSFDRHVLDVEEFVLSGVLDSLYSVLAKATKDEPNPNNDKWSTYAEFQNYGSEEHKKMINHIGFKKENVNLRIANVLAHTLEERAASREKLGKIALQMGKEEYEASVSSKDAIKMGIPAALLLLLGPLSIVSLSFQSASVRYGRTPGRAFVAIFFILVQRFRLGMGGIVIDQYYDKTAASLSTVASVINEVDPQPINA